jgi:hypothetical protein
MAGTYPGGHIRLNAYWFAGSPERLRAAADQNFLVDACGTEIAWHGPMIREPDHVLHHEFGHVVWQSLSADDIESWARSRWAAATRDPSLAPSGYALGSDPQEWFAEWHAMMTLGLLAIREDA